MDRIQDVTRTGIPVWLWLTSICAAITVAVTVTWKVFDVRAEDMREVRAELRKKADRQDVAEIKGSLEKIMTMVQAVREEFAATQGRAMR